MVPPDRRRYLSKFELDPETEYGFDDLPGFTLPNFCDEEIAQFVGEYIFDNEEATAEGDLLIVKKAVNGQENTIQHLRGLFF
jgi:hypothetical protein